MATARELQARHEMFGTSPEQAIGETLRAIQALIVQSEMAFDVRAVTTENIERFAAEHADLVCYLGALFCMLRTPRVETPSAPHLRLVGSAV